MRTPHPGVCIGWARPVKKISDLKKMLKFGDGELIVCQKRV